MAATLRPAFLAGHGGLQDLDDWRRAGGDSGAHAERQRERRAGRMPRRQAPEHGPGESAQRVGRHAAGVRRGVRLVASGKLAEDHRAGARENTAEPQLPVTTQR